MSIWFNSDVSNISGWSQFLLGYRRAKAKRSRRGARRFLVMWQKQWYSWRQSAGVQEESKKCGRTLLRWHVFAYRFCWWWLWRMREFTNWIYGLVVLEVQLFQPTFIIIIIITHLIAIQEKKTSKRSRWIIRWIGDCIT